MHYMDNGSSASQYYFNANSATSSQSYRNPTAPVTMTTTFSSPEYSSYPGGASLSALRSSPSQPIRIDRNTFDHNDTYILPKQHQSVGGFNRTVVQQSYQSSQSSTPQVRASVRTVSNQGQYHSIQPVQTSPQHHHFQFDSRPQAGRPTGVPVLYQTPGAAQFTHRNVDLWTEESSRDRDYHVQVACRVSLALVSLFVPVRLNGCRFDRPPMTRLNNHIQSRPLVTAITYRTTMIN